MINNERRYIRITGKYNILKVLDTSVRVIFDKLVENDVDMLNTVCYNVPVSLLPNVKNQTMRILAGSTIFDIDNLDSTFREHLPVEDVDDEKLLHISAYLMVIREMKIEAGDM